MNDQDFFDLAVKVVANRATDAERAELDAAVADDPTLKAELERIREASRVLKEALPLVNATEATTGDLPGYARARLQAKVRQTLGGPREADQREPSALNWGWRAWVFGLAGATVMMIAVLVLLFGGKSPEPMVQVAMLDLAGTTRGNDAPEIEILRQTWKDARVESFSASGGLEAWEKSWPAPSKQPVVKVIYDRSAGEIRVAGRNDEKRFQKTFPVGPDLQTALKEAASFIVEQTRR